MSEIRIVLMDVLQAVLTAGSSLLSDDKSVIWSDLDDSSQTEVGSQLIEAVEKSAFMRANVNGSQPGTVVISEHENIGKCVQVALQRFQMCIRKSYCSYAQRFLLLQYPVELCISFNKEITTLTWLSND